MISGPRGNVGPTGQWDVAVPCGGRKVRSLRRGWRGRWSASHSPRRPPRVGRSRISSLSTLPPSTSCCFSCSSPFSVTAPTSTPTRTQTNKAKPPASPTSRALRPPARLHSAWTPPPARRRRTRTGTRGSRVAAAAAADGGRPRRRRSGVRRRGMTSFSLTIPSRCSRTSRAFLPRQAQPSRRRRRRTRPALSPPRRERVAAVSRPSRPRRRTGLVSSPT